MQITNRTWGIAVLTVICIFAFILDRTIFAPTKSSAAVQLDSELSEENDLSSNAVNDNSDLPDTKPDDVVIHASDLYNKLNDANDRYELRSVIDHPSVTFSSWNKKSSTIKAVEEPVTVVAKPTYTLNAIMSGKMGGQAIINGTHLAEGETIDDYTLIKIGARSVMLKSNYRELELVLPE